eukprot:TRINITY_DN59844_c0_g1_i1.p1 TRINITY_DN59844_c0_g1~~TRINITY_DN59844_c0_g1_i1.p1  ORF type:complete len:569 (+),score=99.81 TRINITY_DN59844_c0_g1_i1:147-1853(+)
MKSSAISEKEDLRLRDLEKKFAKKEAKSLSVYSQQQKPSKNDQETVEQSVRKQLVETHEHHSAARKIQICMRSFLRRKHTWQMVRWTKQAVRIQAVVRGYICRLFLSRWKQRRLRLITVVQSLVRRWLVLRHTQEVYWIKYDSCVVIQRIFRGYIVQKHKGLFLHNKAALKIQCLWRGSIGRAESDRIWLDRRAIVIQRFVRGYLARTFVNWLKGIKLDAIIRIQHFWKSVLAGKKLSDLLIDCVSTKRRRRMMKLQTEREWFQKREHEIRCQLETEGVDQHVMWQREERESWDLVHEVEGTFVSLSDELRSLSPRSMQQGWAGDLKDQIANQRSEITRTKRNCLFDISLRARKARERSVELNEWIDRVRRLSQSHLEEWERQMNELWEHKSQRNWIVAEHAKKRRVADVKRRFHVDFLTKSFKPAKSFNTTSKAKSKSTVPEESDTLIQFVEDGTDVSAQKLISQAQSNQFLSQIQSMSSLLKPAERINKNGLSSLINEVVQKGAQKKEKNGLLDGFDVANSNEEEIIEKKCFKPPRKKIFCSKVNWGLLTSLQKERDLFENTFPQQ